MPIPTIVPWYGIYGADVDSRWLADVIARHAAAVADGARALEEVRRAEEPGAARAPAIRDFRPLWLRSCGR